MVSEVVLSPESLPTYFTGVGTFVCVRSFVNEKVV